MKKRLFIALFMVLTTLVLAGCDFFSTATIPTSTTTQSTTDETTTAIYTIQFEENGGSAVLDISQANGSAISAPTNPDKTGYSFVGWYSDAGLTSAYTFTTMPAYNTTLYAKWQINQYTLSFEENGGSVITNVTQDYNTAVSEPLAPTKQGYSFLGWYTEPTFTNGYTFTVMPAMNVTLYAKWQINQYTLTFEENGGSPVIDMTQDFNSVITAPTAPTKTGHTFIGWYTESALTNVFAFTTMPANNQTLYAKWEINQYTIQFEENGGTVVLDLTQDYNTPVTPPSEPTMEGHGFGGWYLDAEFVTPYSWGMMPANNQTLYAKWNLNEVTVTFQNEDGTELDVQVLSYGGSATAPADPSKPASGGYIYLFIGWDLAFDNVTQNIIVTAQYSQRYQLLIDFIIASWGEYPPTEEDINQTIEYLILLFGSSDQEFIYNMIQLAMTHINALQSVSTLAEFQAWYAQLAIMGFDEEMLVDMMTSGLFIFVTEKLNNNDIQYLLDEIAYFETELALNEGFLVSILEEVNQYCITLPLEHQTMCAATFNAMVQDQMMFHEYHVLRDQFEFDYYYDSWDYWKYNDMTMCIDSYYYYSYEYVDTMLANQAWADYVMKRDSLSVEEFGMYHPALSTYIQWNDFHYTTLRMLTQSFGGVYDAVHETSALNYLHNEFFYRYNDAFNWTVSYHWMILENTKRIEQSQKDQAMLQLVLDYITSPEGMIRLKTMGITIYDMIDSVVNGMDEATFNLLYSMMSGTFNPELILSSPESISLFMNQAGQMLALMVSSIDAADQANFELILGDIATILVASLGLDPVEADALLAQIQGVIPYYVTGAGEIYQEIIDLLIGMTPTKVDMIIAFVNYLKSQNTISMLGEVTESGPNPEQMMGMIVQVSIMIDTFLYDGTFDIGLIFGYMIDAYYDISMQFEYDPVQKALVKAGLLDLVDQIILLAHEVAIIDPLTAEPEDMMKMYELYSRVNRLIGILSTGNLESILEPFNYLDVHEIFLDIATPYDMPFVQREAMLDMIVTSFGLGSEAETFFTILWVMKYQPMLMSIDSLEDIQAIYLKIGEMGFDNATLAHMIVTFLEEYSEYVLLYEYDPSEILYYQSLLMDYQTYYNTAIGNQDAVHQWVQNEIALMTDPMMQADTLYFWNTLIQDEVNFRHSIDLDNDYRWRDEYKYMWNDDLYYGLQYRLYDYYAYQIDPYFDELYSQYLWNEYLNFYNGMWLEQQAMFATPISVYQNYLQYHFYEAVPTQQAYSNTYFGVMASNGYQPIAQAIIEQYNFLNSYKGDENYWYYEIKNVEYTISKMQELEMFVYFQEFFNVEGNALLFEQTVTIMLDEIGNIIMNASPTTINLIIGLVGGTVNPETLDMTAAGISGYVAQGKVLFDLILSGITPEEKAIIIQFLNAVALEYVSSRSDLTVEQQQALLTTIENAIVEYIGVAESFKTILSNFLGSITELKVQTVMDNVEILNTLPDEYLPGEEAQQLNDNFVRAISMADIIDAMLADDSLDTELILQLVLEGYFDFAYQFNYTGTVDIPALLLALQTLADDTIEQAGVICEYSLYIDEFGLIVYDDPMTTEIVEGLTDEQINEINEFHLLIEEIIELMNVGPELYTPIV